MATIRAVLEVQLLPTPQHPSTSTTHATIKASAEHLLRSEPFLQTCDLTTRLSTQHPQVTAAHLTLSDDDGPPNRVPFWRARPTVHIFVCHEHLSHPSSPSPTPPLRDDASDALADVADVLELPSSRLLRSWESLHLRPGVKAALLGYVRAGWLLGEKGVDGCVVAWNGVLLLHGPPGTGKTSLCRALAQKVAVRVGMGGATLVEVRVERLMSKWFSESSQRVREVFDRIGVLAGVRAFVVVVLDEVESVGLSRKGRVDGTEPGDAIRVVNALLGGIDSLRDVRNVVVVCTSNLLCGIDEALVDRADVRVYVGEPGEKARLAILNGVVRELVEKGVVEGGEGKNMLDVVCQACEGLSGRALRKLAVLALAIVGVDADCRPVGEGAFLEALVEAAKTMKEKGEDHVNGLKSAS